MWALIRAPWRDEEVSFLVPCREIEGEKWRLKTAHWPPESLNVGMQDRMFLFSVTGVQPGPGRRTCQRGGCKEKSPISHSHHTPSTKNNPSEQNGRRHSKVQTSELLNFWGRGQIKFQIFFSPCERARRRTSVTLFRKQSTPLSDLPEHL